MSEGQVGPGVGLLARTGYAVRSPLRRTDARAVFVGTTLGYLLAYLYAIGHLASGTGGFDLTVVPNAATRFLQPSLNAFSFEPVMVVTAGPVTYLFSLNTVLGLGLAALVGVNIAVTYLVWRQPAACGIGSQAAGALAGLPALLSGAACCGPVVLIGLGAQVTGLLLTAFELLLPVAVALLLASLLFVGRRVHRTRTEPGVEASPFLPRTRRSR